MMKNVRAMFAAMTLGLILSSTAFAGEVNTPGYVPPPPPPAPAPLQENETTAAGDISTPGIAGELLAMVLSAIY